MFPNDGVSDGFLTSGVFFHHQINFYLLDLKAQWVRFSTIQWSESTLQTVISHWICRLPAVMFRVKTTKP